MSTKKDRNKQVERDFRNWVSTLNASKPVQHEILHGHEMQDQAAKLAWIAAFEFYRKNKGGE